MASLHGGRRLISTPLYVDRSVPGLGLNLCMNFSCRRTLISKGADPPYNRQQNSSSCCQVCSSILMDLPRERNAFIYSGCCLIVFSTVFLPFLTNELVESLPLNAWSAGSAEHKSIPVSSITRCMSIRLLRFPTPVSNSTLCSMFCAKCRTRTKTSVSGDLMMMSFTHEFSAECKQWRTILVSASSWVDLNFSTSSAVVLRPS